MPLGGMSIAILSLAALPVELTVVVEPGDDPCQLAERVPAALRRVLPATAITTGRDPGAPRVGTEVHVSPRGVVLTLTVEGRGPSLERELPNPPDACAATADGVALVVERHLRDLDRPLEVTTATVTPAQPDARTTTSTPTPELSSSFALDLGLAARGALGLDPGRSDGGPKLTPDLGGTFLVRLASPLPVELGAEVDVATLGSQDILRRGRVLGSIRATSVRALLSASVCARADLELCLTLGGGLERLAGSEEGSGIFRGRSSAVLSGAAVADLRVGLARPAFVRPFLTLGALARPERTVFSVEGADTSYRLPRIALSASVGAWFTIF